MTKSAPAAAESALAKLRRVLPAALTRRLDALADTAGFTRTARPAVAPEARVLLLLAEAARDGRRVAFTNTDRAGRGSERVLVPYGVVAHSGRWYATGPDSASGEVRTFRLDRITAPALRGGPVAVPDDFDAPDHVLAALARTPWRHEVSVLVEGSVDEVRDRLPTGLAAVREADDGRARVELRAERLDWVPAVLVGLRRPFVVERPEELRAEVRALAEQLTAWSERSVRRSG
ncbi:WYL domain-containing protein [Pseudonocardia xishanensis]|uniref:helix-turn-helix transcriptional regulator n=1 Tax=Pseudonocardia xishanensis TaxID=630995 RepID=UPI0031F02178